MKKWCEIFLHGTSRTLVWLIILILSVFSSEPISAAGHEVFQGIYTHSFGSEKCIALTFDDGPHPWHTPRILEILDHNHAKASFFLVGRLCIRYPQLVRDIHLKGHTVCNHSFNHWNMTRLDYERDLFEWQACSEAIENATGRRPDYCRPPGGKFNRNVIESANESGMKVIGWSVNSLDCAGKGSEQIRQLILQKLEPGAIILLHDGFESTIEALPTLIADIRKREYDMVTLDEMFHSR